jgi:uncharacterized membrane protein
MISTTQPTNPDAGSIYFNTNDNRLYIYTGNGWVRTAVLMTP